MSDDVSAPAFYRLTAEMVAILLPTAWEGLGPALRHGLDDLVDARAAEAAVLDVGAGTGLALPVVAEARPGADIVAVEPDGALRTALAATIATSPFRERVTIVDSDLDGALASGAVPARLGTVLLMNVLGHFDAGARRGLWAVLQERLVPGGAVFLTLYPPTRPAEVPESPMAEVTLGRRRYTGRAAASPAGPDALTWTMSYRVEHDGRSVAEFDSSSHWTVVSAEGVAEEAAEHGLVLSEVHAATFLYALVLRE